MNIEYVFVFIKCLRWVVPHHQTKMCIVVAVMVKASLNFYKTKQKSSCWETRTKTLFILLGYFRRNDHESFGRRAAFTAKGSYLQSGVEETENPRKGKIICIALHRGLGAANTKYTATVTSYCVAEIGKFIKITLSWSDMWQYLLNYS